MGFIDGVKKFFGYEIPAPVGQRTLVASVADDLPIFRQFTRIGGAVTPEDFSSFLRYADQGFIFKLVSFANESREKDGHLQGILGQREDALQELEWEWYYPHKDPESSSGSRQRRFLEEQTVDNPEFSKLIAHISGDFYYGFSATEAVLRKDVGKLVLDYVKPVDHRRCGFATRDGRLIFRDDPFSAQEIRFEDYEPGKWIITKRRMNGDIESREGLLRVLLWAALFRNWSLSDLLRLAEIAWKPYRVLTYKKNGYEQKEKDDLEGFLDRLTASGILMIPDDVSLKVEWPQGAGSSASGQNNHSMLHSTLGREMSKAVLGQDGTTEQGAMGSYGKAVVQDGITDKKLGADARSAAHWITQSFAKPLVAMNFGPQADVPSLRFKIVKPVDTTKVASAISVLSTAGLRIPAKWARQQIGAPTPKEGEELVSDGKPAPVASPAKVGPDGKPIVEPADGNDSEDPKDQASEEPK